MNKIILVGVYSDLVHYDPTVPTNPLSHLGDTETNICIDTHSTKCFVLNLSRTIRAYMWIERSTCCDRSLAKSRQRQRDAENERDMLKNPESRSVSFTCT